MLARLSAAGAGCAASDRRTGCPLPATLAVAASMPCLTLLPCLLCACPIFTIANGADPYIYARGRGPVRMYTLPMRGLVMNCGHEDQKDADSLRRAAHAGVRALVRERRR